MTLHAALDPLLRLELACWSGLPQACVAQFDALFGAPEDLREDMLGSYPASHKRYRTDGTAGGLSVWVRDGIAVMVQTLQPPDAAVLATLPEPTAVLAHEIQLPDAYAHEYLYCPVGLVLTVAQAYRKGRPLRVVRCRGTRPLKGVGDFGPAYYQALEDQIRWTGTRPDGVLV